jgi:hypothetical protein
MIDVKNRIPQPGKEGRVQLTPVAGQPNIFDLAMADDATENGIPWSRRTGQLLQADIRTLPIAAGNTVAAGDVVDVVDGEVQKTIVANANTKAVFNNAATTYTSVTNLNETYSVSSYATGTTGVAKLINNQTGEAIGSAVSFSSVATTYISCARLSDTQFIVAYTTSTGLYTKLGTIAGTNISFSSEAQPSPYANKYNVLIPLSTTSVFCAYSSGVRLGAKVLTVSGGVISASGAEALIEGVAAAYISATRLPDSGGNRRVCVCYSDTGDGNKGKAVITTINASNVVLWGTPVVFASAGTRGTACIEIDGRVLVVNAPNVVAENVKYTLLMIDSSTISLLDSKTLGNYSEATVAIAKVAGGGVVLYNLSVGGGGGRSSKITVVGDTLSPSPNYPFNGTASASSPSIAGIADDKVIVAYTDGGNSNYGIVTLLTVKGNQIAGSFTNTSSQAIALQSGTSPQSIDIIFDGVAELPSITAGTQITSAGVQGYAPQDGWLWVKPEWDNAQCVFGTYIGNGNAEREILLGFKPAAVIVYAENGAQYYENSGAGSSSYGGLAIQGLPCIRTWDYGTRKEVVTATDTGFKVFYLYSGINAILSNAPSGQLRYYIAFRR